MQQIKTEQVNNTEFFLGDFNPYGMHSYKVHSI